MPTRSLLWLTLQSLGRIFTTLFFNLRVTGLRNIPRRGPALIVSIHQGTLDPLFLGAHLQRPVSFMAKSELFDTPLSARFFRSLNTYPVRQGAGDISAIKETIHRLQIGHLLNIFPEGSRSEDGAIAPLQKGVALIIKRANVPVIPAVITGSFQAWPIHQRLPKSHPVHVHFGPPLDLANLSSHQILQTLDRTLREMLREQRQFPVATLPKHC